MDGKYCFQIWSSDRKIKKAFLCVSNLEEVIKKCNTLGISGSKLVIETNGCEVIDDETLEYFANQKQIFLLLNENEEWYPEAGTSKPHNDSFKNIISTTNDSEILFCAETSKSHNDSFKNIISTTNDSEILFCEDEINENEFDVILSPLLQNDLDSALASNISLSSTLSMSSTAFSSASSANSQVKKVFSDFVIPWEKLPTDILRMLQNGEKLGYKMNSLANVIVDELRLISFYIPMAVFRNVSMKAAEKYPKSIIETDSDGNLICNVPIALITKMRNRNNTLNRTKRNVNEIHQDIPINKRKKFNILKQTCPNWQPNMQDKENGIYKRDFMKNLHVKTKLNEDENQIIKKYMSETYSIQRSYLNNAKNVPEIKEVFTEWPFLFVQEFIYEHFNTLINKDPRLFIANFNAKKNSIIKYFKNKKIALSGKLYNDAFEMVLYLIAFFKEENKFLFEVFEHGTALDEIQQNIPTNTPWIAIVENSSLQPSLCYIFIEKHNVLSEMIDDFSTILCKIICFFYIFNMTYPKGISQTMEFLVRYFLKIYSEYTRGSKKTINNLSKINNLITILSKFEN